MKAPPKPEPCPRCYGAGWRTNHYTADNGDWCWTYLPCDCGKGPTAATFYYHPETIAEVGP